MPTLIRNRPIHLFLLTTLLSVAGCFSLSRSAPPQQHYVLGDGGLSEQAAPLADRPVTDSSEILIGLRPPRLADYLATPFIVVRRGTHQVEFSEYHRWGENLGRAINRIVAERMAARAPPHRVVAAPWPRGTSPEHLIQVHIQRFEGLMPEDGSPLEGQVHMLATWEILRQEDGAVLTRGATDYREGGWRVGDYTGLVTLLDAGLRVLSDDLAAGIGKLTVSSP